RPFTALPSSISIGRVFCSDGKGTFWACIVMAVARARADVRIVVLMGTSKSSVDETDGPREAVLADDDVGRHGRDGWGRRESERWQRRRGEIAAQHFSTFERRPCLGARPWQEAAQVDRLVNARRLRRRGVQGWLDTPTFALAKAGRHGEP